MNARRIAAIVLWGVASVGGLIGVALLVWAANREYADNQRNWGYALGFIGLFGAVFLAIIGRLVRGGRRPAEKAD